ncbi:MAG: hypothetical protein M3139_04140 [Bacteroidota bacterium]|nr:hypothetical protein [Bacteroidota bacterium]
MTAVVTNKSAINKIKSLRREKLSSGIPFMINSDQLPSHQCYMEYPDGSIKVVEANSKEGDFKIIEELDFLNKEVLLRSLNLV